MREQSTDYTDELPQLYSILKGDISFVGPRPALFNQDDLVELRTEKGVHGLIPGCHHRKRMNPPTAEKWTHPAGIL